MKQHLTRSKGGFFVAYCWFVVANGGVDLMAASSNAPAASACKSGQDVSLLAHKAARGQ